MSHSFPRILAGAALCGLLTAVPAAAQEVIRLTIASSHPIQVPWIGEIPKVFIPEVNRLLAEAGGDYQIAFTEAYGGQLYKVSESLSAVGQGLTDIGWVFSLVEPSTLPLTQVTGYTPGVTGDPRLLMAVFNELNDTLPALQQEWAEQNVTFLSATAGDTHQLFTKAPVTDLASLNGRKLSAPGTVGTWFGGTGAVAVDGTATSFYTDVATGVTEGVSTTITVAESTKLTEVAPNVTLVDLGATFFGGLIINQDIWDDLPEPVQVALKTAARRYSEAVGAEVVRRQEASLARLRAEGPGLSPPVTVTELSPEARARWFETMPNLAQTWVEANEARGLPARAVLRAYLDAAARNGATPARDWALGLLE